MRGCFGRLLNEGRRVRGDVLEREEVVDKHDNMIDMIKDAAI